MIPMAHHGLGEEMLIPALASGGTLVSVLVLGTKLKLAELRRWIRRR
jgi:hypothetical protein